jgi:hypothetical protein
LDTTVLPFAVVWVTPVPAKSTVAVPGPLSVTVPTVPSASLNVTDCTPLVPPSATVCCSSPCCSSPPTVALNVSVADRLVRAGAVLGHAGAEDHRTGVAWPGCVAVTVMWTCCPARR